MEVKGIELGDECAICGSKENLEVHHIVPISKGGTNEVENLAILCRKCNREIYNRIIPIMKEQFEIGQFGGDGTRELFAKGGIRKTISFEGDAKEIIEKYRRERKDIPSFTKAVNEIIKGGK